MNLFDKTYQAVDLTNTSTAEAIGIVYTAMCQIDESTLDDASDFVHLIDAFNEFSWNHVDRVPEDEYNDNIHRSDGNYCVRLRIDSDNLYNYCDNEVSFMISIGTNQLDSEPNLTVCFQRVEEVYESGHIERIFTNIANISLTKDTIEYLLNDK